ncbi:MAG: contractile injection system tape measure protein [Pseudomonadota bacterium]
MDAIGPHRVGRVDVQASVADFDMALSLRPRIEALAWKLMPGVIERVFDRVAPRDMHVKLARLDLDLGRVRPDHLEEDMLAALETALEDALGDAIHSARMSPSDEARLVSPEAARLDAFETYLATGVVPLAGRFDPGDQLRALAAGQPGELVAMLRRRGRERHVLERLVLQAGEAGLRSLLALLAPADAAVILALIADVIVAHRDKAVTPLVGLAEPALKRLLWVSTLEFLLRDAGTQFNRRRFLAFLLGREAARAGVDYAELLRVLGETVARIKARMGFRSSLPVVLAELLAEAGQAAAVDEAEAPADASEAAAFAAARAGDFAALLALVRSRVGNAPALEALVRRLDATLFAGLVRLLEPTHAAQILAILDDLNLAHRAEVLPVLPEIAFEQRLRFLTLRYLIQDAGSQFNRRRFLGSLLEQEAARAGIDYAVLLRLLADGVGQMRARTGIRSAMPAVLAELLVELQPIYAPEAEAPPADPSGAAALAAAQAGDFDALLALLRVRAEDVAGFAALAGAMPAAVFEQLVQRLKRSSAPAILEDIAAVIALHRAGRVVAMADGGFARLVRGVALRMLLGEGGRFDRRVWLRRLLLALAEAADVSEAALRLAMARALAGQGGGRSALAAELAVEMEAEGLPTEPAALTRAIADLDEAGRHRLLAGLDAANAEAVEADLRALVRLHAAEALLPIDAAGFGDLVWALAIAWLKERRGARFDRRAFGRHLIEGIARHGGKTVRAVAGEVQRSLAQVASGSDAAYALLDSLSREAAEQRADETDQRRAIEHFLRTGQPPSAGRGLAALARADSVWLAALIRRLARDTPGTVPALLDRLLAWLLPEELLDCLAPGSAARALQWADATGSDMAAWRPVFAALLRGETPPFAVVPGSTGTRLDRLALIAHWLDHGTTAWWSDGGAPRALLGDLPGLTLAELTWLFLADDPEAGFERLWRAVEPLGKAARMRLIERLAPWATSAGGPLAGVLAGLDERRRLEMLVRAAAAAIEGVQLDMAALARPAPVPTPAPSALPRPDDSAIDSARLFAWLDGAHAGAAETQALIRAFARLADARDSALIEYLAARRTNAAAQMRWATVLPPEALGRLVHLLVPAGARAYLDAAMTIAAAWRQVAPFGARRVDRSRIWAMLLEAIAEPGAVDLPGAVERLVQGLTRGDAAQAAKLRAQAQRLAQDGGHVAVAVALKRPLRAADSRKPASRPAPESVKPAGAAAEEKPLPPDPDHAIFIGNAGLVLLNPYLPALFERLGLITKNEEGLPRIEGVEAQSRAVHLLQYMADGHTDRPEPELVLNKLLSGVAVAQPIEPSITPTPVEIETCDGLLHAVIANWTIIRNTSIDGLRETFLRREGRLLHSDGRWDLHVQRKGLDVLVDQVPWTFSMIYHRWMADPIQVTW